MGREVWRFLFHRKSKNHLTFAALRVYFCGDFFDPYQEEAMRKGIIPPLITPLTHDERLDTKGLRRLIDHVVAGGVHGIFVLGTNGEGLALRDSVKEEVVACAAEAASGRVPVLANVSDLSTARALENVRWAHHAGADEVVATPPFYFPYPPVATERFFLQLAETSSLPVWIYENPATTGVTTPFEVFARLAAHENIVGIKYSGTDLAFLERLVKELRSPEFVVFTGLVQDNVAALQLGVDGIVPGIANVLPHIMVGLYNAVRAGQMDNARTFQKLVDAARAIYGEKMRWWPAAPKVILHELGVISTEVVVAPFEPLSQDARSEILKIWGELTDSVWTRN
jgi:4-hydroxy-tetrahydrodipicolinate synthase